MRYILSFPAIAIVIAAYNAFVLGTLGMLGSGSQMFSWVLPSGAEAYFMAGDLFVIAGLVALFLEMLKAARAGPSTVVDHALSAIIFIVALAEFLLVPFCGTAAFLILTVMALVDLVAGLTASMR